MTQGIVDSFELIEIDMQHRGRLFCADAAFDEVFNALNKELAIREIGE